LQTILQRFKIEVAKRKKAPIAATIDAPFESA